MEMLFGKDSRRFGRLNEIVESGQVTLFWLESIVICIIFILMCRMYKQFSLLIFQLQRCSFIVSST